ncbi:MAG TPA: hypothetical protein VFM71_12875 [Gemmatimonadaceae bacterium]|nr:hypothetical protein [Gemmatimonadaceae bacterium]
MNESALQPERAKDYSVAIHDVEELPDKLARRAHRLQQDAIAV